MLLVRIAAGRLTPPNPAAAPPPLRERLVVEEGHILRVRLAGQSLVDSEVEHEAFVRAGFHPTNWDHAYHSALMDLTKSDADLMAALDHKWRTNLRHGLQAELAIDVGDTADLRARFLTLYDDAQRLKGFDVDIPPEFYFELAGPDLRLDVLIVHQDGVDLAGGVSGFTGPAGIYLFAATPQAGRQFRAGYLLTWQVITRSRELGATTFDIGGIDVTGHNEEVARFKHRLHGTPIDNQVYETDGGGSAVPMIRALEGLHHRMHHRAHP
ncbi:MAG: peptidoglycan bridge formation glycyltransferase FemA/FemB family protein [Acidimicrobiaceae bacterium]|nr:peptidoglycan bridge formation glycyltransferase FemA/FemB family protein [Acidimicrobiaceae bacterium]